MKNSPSKIAQVLILGFALTSTSAELAADIPQIDDFDIGSGLWYNFIVENGNATASISNEGEPINAGGYAELAGVSLYIDSWGDWAQASLGVSAENNGVSYDLAQCREGFSYKYKGNAHRFGLQSKKNDLQVIHYEDIASAANNWTSVTVNSFVRDEYDAAYLAGDINIPLDLSKVMDIHWSVRPSDENVTTSGYLQIKDFECETAPPTTAAGIASYHGRLYACGNQICGEKSGKTVQVKGPSFDLSLPDPSWAWGYKFYKTETVNALVDNWNAQVVRAFLAVSVNKDRDGKANDWSYEYKPNENWSLVKEVVDAAIAKDIYVIINWGSHFAHESAETALAKDFFTNPELAGQYGNNPNVIFEIYNEPIGQTGLWSKTSWATIKTYHNTMIKAIRDAGFNNLILLGTPNWDAEVNAGISDLPTDPENNYAFVFHFYANTHKIDGQAWFATDKTYRSLLQSVLNANSPIFVSEYGTVDADGTGTVNAAEADKWHAFLNENKISSAAWGVSSTEPTGFWVNSPLFLDDILGADISHWNDPKNMTKNGRYLYRLFTGNDTTTNGQEYVIQWPEFTGASSSIPTSGYYGWADAANGVTYQIQDITNGGKFDVQLGSKGIYAGFGTWIQNQSIGLEKCQYGITYSYLGAAHTFWIYLPPDDSQLQSKRTLKKTTAWTQATHQWKYFDDFSGIIKSFVWQILAGEANKTSESLQVKDVLCLDPSTPPPSSSSTTPSSSSTTPSSSGTTPSSSSTTLSSSSGDDTPIRLPQIATSNHVMQIANGVSLSVKSNATIQVFNLNGKSVLHTPYLPSGVYNVSLKHLPKGMYIVKVKFSNRGSDRILRVPVL
jgi:endoglucanase